MKKLKVVCTYACIILVISLLFSSVSTVSSVAQQENTIDAVIPQRIFKDSPGGSPSPSPKGMKLIAQKGYLALHADLKTSEFALEDTRTGCFLYSNPVDREEDTYAQGAIKNELSSQLAVTDISPQTNTTKKRNVVAQCLKKGGLSTQPIQDGFSATYKFVDQKYEITVDYVLYEDSLKVSVDTRKIVEQGNEKIFNIALLPYFGAAGPNEKGFMLMPDGTGSIIHFNTHKNTYSQYRSKIYGRDWISPLDYVPNEIQTASFPVYGMQRLENGFVAIAEDGAGAGNINAALSGISTMYNTAFFDFDVRIINNATIGTGWNAKDVVLYEETGIRTGIFSVRYFPITRQKADVPGMAEVVREYLKGQYNMKPNIPSKAPMYVNTLGAVRKRTSVLGMRMNFTQKVTTFTQAAKMVNELSNLGIYNINLLYEGWSESEIRGKATAKYDPIQKLGGKSALKELSEGIARAEGKLFLNTETVRIYNSGNGASYYFDTAKDLSLFPIKVKTYKRNTFHPDLTKKDGRLLNINQAGTLLDTLGTALDKKISGVGVSMGMLGNTLYNDFSDGGNPRSSAPSIISRQMEQMAGKIDMLGTNPNMYVLPYVKAVTHLPNSSSKFDITDTSVPFYQMVLHGMLPYASQPINQSGSPQEEFLYAIETGAMLSYDLIGSDPAELKNTSRNDLYASNFNLWKETIAAQYEKLQKLYTQTSHQPVTHYEELLAGVIKTEYGNGTYTIVNHNKTGVDINGVFIPPLDFILQGGHSNE